MLEKNDLVRHMQHPVRLLKALSRTGTLLGILWASPLTMFALLLASPILLAAEGRLARVDHRTPALLITGSLADRMLAMHPLGGVIAMAIGHVVIARSSALSARLLEHELTHVRQAARWGLLFPLVYLGSSVVQAMRGRNIYIDNVFEVEARAAENSLVTQWAKPFGASEPPEISPRST